MNSSHAIAGMLPAYADGTLSEGMSLVVACHLTHCPACRSQLARLEDIGGTGLKLTEAVAVSGTCIAATLARIETLATAPANDPAGEIPHPEAGVLPFPGPLRQRIGAGENGIRWKFLMPGLAEHRLQGFDGEEVSILRARPGVRIPSHTHAGEEATIILAGTMRDGDTLLEQGDVALADHHDDHRPEILGPDTCYCLTVVRGRLRFTGPIGKALNLFNTQR